MNLFKNPLFLSILSGLLLALGWPTYGMPLLLFIAFIPLFYAESILRKSGRNIKFKIWIYSYICFLTWNFITTWWLYYASLFGMLFAVLVNSLLMSFLFLTYHIVSKRVSQN